MTGSRTPAVGTARPGRPARAAAGALLRAVTPAQLIIFAVVALAYTAAGAGVAFSGYSSNSVWAHIGWVLQWAVFGAGIAIGVHVPTLVAHGLTRRTTMLAGTATVLLLAAGTAALVQAGLLVERAIYRAAEQPYTLGGTQLFRSIDQVHLVIADYTLMFAGFLVTGWLLVTVYQLLGWWWGTLAAPLTFLPAAGTLGALSAGWVRHVEWEGGGTARDLPWTVTLGQPLAVALATAVVAGGLLTVWLLTRTMPIRKS